MCIHFADIDKMLKSLRPLLQEYKDHLKALQSGESFTPQLTAKNSKKRARSSTPDSNPDSSTGKKRKRRSDKERSSKRRKSSDMDDDDDDFIVDDDEELEFSEDDDGKTDSGSEEDPDSETQSGDENEQVIDEDVTEESLQKKIEETDEGIKEGRIQLSEQRRLRKEATDSLAALKKTQDGLQREKNAFCSLKRSEVRLVFVWSSYLAYHPT